MIYTMMKRKFLLIACLVLGFATAGIAQSQTVEGTVTDAEAGDALPGVNVVIGGSTTGTTTDLDGRYSIEVSGPDDVLVFSYVGYTTQEITVGNQQTIDAALQPDFAQLDEMVVIGYGSVRKSDLTGSVKRVDASRFENQSMTQLTDMLIGSVAGFNASQGTSASGGSSLEVRGANSLSAGTEPMIVLDGVVYPGNLNDINPNDIETIDILKDASSAAIFGAKAASGVILITTTKGVKGKPTVNFSTELGVTSPTNARRPFSGAEFTQYRGDYFRTMDPNIEDHYYTNPENLPDGLSVEEWRTYSDNPNADPEQEWFNRIRLYEVERQALVNGQEVDWYDRVIQDGVRQNYDLSVSGGSDDVNYYWSLGYVDNEGVIVGDQFSTIRSRLNLDYQVNGWLNIGTNTQFSARDESSIEANLGTMYTISPYGKEYEDDGSLSFYPGVYTIQHPLLNHYGQDRQRDINTIFSNLRARVDLPFGINYELSFQPQYSFLKDYNFWSTDTPTGAISHENGYGTRHERSEFEWQVDNLLKWNREIGVHNFDVTLLYNLEKAERWDTFLSNENFAPSGALRYYGMQFGSNPFMRNDDRYATGDAIMGRLNYSLLGRYLVTASIRRDGYSAFGQETPRANFPAAAFAWQIDQESFYNIDWMNQMKLRLSWGVNGNRDIGIYSALARLGSEVYYNGSDTQVGVYNTELSNPGLEWEKTESINIGVDLSFFESRIDLSADYYDMTTTNLLMNRRLPSLTGFSSVTSNLGELANSGFELDVRTINFARENASWSTNLIFSFNRNKIVRLFGDEGEYTVLGESRTGELPDYTNEWFPGQAIDAVWDYDNVEIWQEDEAAEAAVYGMRPGDFKATDVNDDGEFIESDDKRFIGHREPRFRLGFGNNVSYRNWTASLFVRADLGHIGPYPEMMNGGSETYDRRSRVPLPYWTPENPSNEYARLDVNTGGYGGGLTVYKSRSFVRVQNLSVGYNLPAHIASQFQMNSLRIFANAQNLLTFTKWPHWDPEPESSTYGIGNRPMPRTFTLGLSFQL